MWGNIHAGPVAEIQAIAVDADAVNEGRNDGNQFLVIEWEPANVLDGYLFRLIVEGKTGRACRLFCLRYLLIEGWIVPATVIVAGSGKQIERETVIRVGNFRAPLNEAKLNLLFGSLVVICRLLGGLQVDLNTQCALPHVLQGACLLLRDKRTRIGKCYGWHSSTGVTGAAIRGIHRLPERFCHSGIIRNAGITLLIARHTGWNDRLRR